MLLRIDSLFVLTWLFAGYVTSQVYEDHLEEPSDMSQSRRQAISRWVVGNGGSKPAIRQVWKEAYKIPFRPIYMNYCDMIVCNEYHRTACGLNRNTMTFRFFQSGCHLKLNNKCSNYLGAKKYDLVRLDACMRYVMHLRSGCSSDCDHVVKPVCGLSTVDNHIVLFKNLCYFEAANCRSGKIPEYIEVRIEVCQHASVKNIYVE